MTLSDEDKRRVLEYQVIAQELLGYSEADIRDVFIRMNKYVFQLSRQELRHARESGAFARFAAEVGAWSEWADLRVFTATTLSRMRAVEFAAELAILLIEGPQDKKSAVDLYYKQYREEFQEGARVSEQLRTYLSWITAALPDLRTTRFRKPVDLYSLIGALHELNAENRLKDISPDSAGEALRNFEAETKEEAPGIDAARYVAAASRQTDNIRPRQTRIEILERILAGA